MISFQVIGGDVAITMGCEAGQLELNVFEPIVIYNLLMSLQILVKGCNTLREKCIEGITANPERCQELVDNSIGIVTALLPKIGYKKASEAAKAALERKLPVAQVVQEMGLLTAEETAELLQPEAMTQPSK